MHWEGNRGVRSGFTNPLTWPRASWVHPNGEEEKNPKKTSYVKVETRNVPSFSPSNLEAERRKRIPEGEGPGDRREESKEDPRDPFAARG